MSNEPKRPTAIFNGGTIGELRIGKATLLGTDLLHNAGAIGSAEVGELLNVRTFDELQALALAEIGRAKGSLSGDDAIRAEEVSQAIASGDKGAIKNALGWLRGWAEKAGSVVLTEYVKAWIKNQVGSP